MSFQVDHSSDLAQPSLDPDVPLALLPNLSSAPDAIAMLHHVVAAAQAVTGSDGAAILLYDRDSGLFVPTTSSVAVGLDERWLQRQGLEAARSLAVRAADGRDVAVIADTDATPDLDFPLLHGGRRPRGVIAVPLEAEGVVVGVLELYTAAPQMVAPDRAALRSFAALGGLAITTAQAHQREHALRARLEALDEASKALAAELSPDRVLRRIVELAARLVGARYGALGVLGPDGYLSDFITTGLSPQERERIGPLPHGHGLLGLLIREGQPVRVPDMARDARRVGFPPHHPPMASLLGVPVRVRGEVVGDLYLTDKLDAPAFTDDDERLIEMLAAHAAVAIENARLYGQVRELSTLRERERIGRDLHDGIIQDIYAGTLQLEDISEDIPDAPLRQRLLGLADHFDGVIRDVRTYIQGLRARELEGRLLAEGLGALVREVDQRGDLAATFVREGETYRLPDEVANALLQITREALSNVTRHARATQAAVRLSYDPLGVSLTIADNGQGFDPNAAHGEEHRGLRNLRERAAEIGGTLSLQSAPGAGATIAVRVPAR